MEHCKFENNYFIDNHDNDKNKVHEALQIQKVQHGWRGLSISVQIWELHHLLHVGSLGEDQCGDRTPHLPALLLGA